METNKELLLRLINRVTLEYVLTEKTQYYADINTDGRIFFSSPKKQVEKQKSPLSVKQFIQRNCRELFMEDTDSEGTVSPESYCWKLTFYTKKGIVRCMEGMLGESQERFRAFEELFGKIGWFIGERYDAYAYESICFIKQKETETAERLEKAKAARQKKCPPAENAIIALSQKLLRSAAAHSEAGKNVMISPASIGIMLSLLAYAAKGKSREELLEYLGTDSADLLEEIGAILGNAAADKAVAAANAIYADKATAPHILPEFIKKMCDSAQTDILSNDTDAVAAINEWVKEKTRGMIPELLSKESRIDNLALLNAVCFEAKWENQITDYCVSKDYFTRLDGKKEKADFMTARESFLLLDENAVGFMKPYADSDYMFMALLPQKTNDPAEFIDSLPQGELGRYIRGAAEIAVDIKMPEFSFDSSADIKAILRSEGVNCVFDPNTADVSNMLPVPGSYVSSITHKARIELDRYGTKAAAVTIETFYAGSMYADPVYEVILDRPFVFGIVHRETGIPLFLGTVNTVS